MSHFSTVLQGLLVILPSLQSISQHISSQPGWIQGGWEKGQSRVYSGLSVLKQTSQIGCTVIFVSTLSLLDKVTKSSDRSSEDLFFVHQTQEEK